MVWRWVGGWGVGAGGMGRTGHGGGGRMNGEARRWGEKVEATCCTILTIIAIEAGSSRNVWRQHGRV